MDRATIYAGQVPLETDLLRAQQNSMVGLAKMAAAVLGTPTVVNGFTCSPTSPASLNVIVSAGEIYQIANLEATAWSSLTVDTHSILKQGIVLDPTTFGITPPITVGFSQNFLIEAQYLDSDTGSTVLPYYNAASPAVPFSGPGNAGTAQNTVRKGVASMQVKAGIAAATGTQVTPTADAGWTGLFVVTVANGATTITSGNISQVVGAPFIPVTLPGIPAAMQNGNWISFDDTGTQNALAISPVPAVTAYAKYQEFRVKLANAITGASTLNVSGQGPRPIVNIDGSPTTNGSGVVGEVAHFIYDGTNFQKIGLQIGTVPVLTAARIYYVNGATGLDTYDGTTATVGGGHGPFQTIQKACNVVSTLNANGFVVTINIADFASYAAFSVTKPTNGSLRIIGNATTPANVVITTSTASACVGVNGAGVSTFIQGMRVVNSAAGGHGFIAQAGGHIDFQDVDCNLVNGSHFFCDAGSISCFGNYSITSNASGNHIQVGTQGLFILTPSGTNTVTVVGGAISTTYFASVADISLLRCNTRTTFTGAMAGGTKYNVTGNGVINTGGAGIAFFPAPTAGVTASGGQYI